MTIGIGLLGAGDMAKVHARALVCLPQVRLAAVCDRSPARRKELKQSVGRPDIREYAAWPECLRDDGIHAVILCLPNALHAAAAIDAVNAGKHVLLEKPMGRTVAECRRIERALASRPGLVLQIGFVLRHQPAYQFIHRLLQQPETGAPALLWASEHRPNFPSRWRYSQALSGGALVEKCCHQFDLFNWWSNSRPVKVWACGGQAVIRNGFSHRVYCPPHRDIIVRNSTILDHALVGIEYENGIKASLVLCLFLSWKAHACNAQEIGVLSKHGVKIITDGKRVDVLGMARRGFRPGRDHDRKTTAVEQEQRAFIRSILGGQPPAADARVGTAAIAIAEAAEKAIRTGTPIRL